ncbi:MAG: hypothetical protein IKE48_03315, partial [Parasporobacterium sp.]|nr:hypothetical protein [Parasporobacterium sp.]
RSEAGRRPEAAALSEGTLLLEAETDSESTLRVISSRLILAVLSLRLLPALWAVFFARPEGIWTLPVRSE